jgi:CDP-diacylglycerol--glycerol-3-phosphate 3-phosphatidyltransferase
MSRPFWQQPANALTALRLLCIPAIAVAVLDDRHAMAAALFALAVATDLADGPVARRRGEASARGALFDHAVDAGFVATLLAALAWHGTLTGALPIVVVLAFLQYAWDSDVLHGHALRTSVIGRNNGIAYYVAAGVPVVRDALGLDWPSDAAVQTLAWLLVATTLLSMAERGIVFVRLRTRGRR